MLRTIVTDDTDYNVYSPIIRVYRPAGVASRGALVVVELVYNGSPRIGGSTPALTST
jgi:hypothetical protein